MSVGEAAGLPTPEWQLVEQGDAARSAAKAGGRDQVVLSPDPDAVAVATA